MKRVLVIEGNEASTRERIRKLTGLDSAQAYRETLQRLEPGLEVDIADPSDPAYALPSGVTLADYAGVAMTGSALNIYDRSPVIERQLAFVAGVFEHGLPFFGSCWGLQVAVTVAGGRVERHARGHEFGFARRIRLTALGASHQMFVGKPLVYEAPTVHLDHITRVPAQAQILAENDHSIQALSFAVKRARVWGVQYHPEYTFADIAAVAQRYGSRLVDDGTFESEPALASWIADCERLHQEPTHRALNFKYGLGPALTDEALRWRELQNWLHQLTLD